MKVIYDFNQENPLKKCYAEDLDGTILGYFGCFNIKVEETNIDTGKPFHITEIKRWGTKKERNNTHKKICDYISEGKTND